MEVTGVCPANSALVNNLLVLFGTNAYTLPNKHPDPTKGFDGGVRVIVGVTVFVGVIVGVCDGDAPGVLVTVGVCDGDTPGVLVTVGVGVFVGVRVRVGVGVNGNKTPLILIVLDIGLLLAFFIEANNTSSNFLRNCAILFKFTVPQPNYYPDRNKVYHLPRQCNNQ
jgi:hypothetical protein